MKSCHNPLSQITLLVTFDFGDIGCSGDPAVVGMVSGALGDNLKMGILAGIVFPVLMLIRIILCGKMSKKCA